MSSEWEGGMKELSTVLREQIERAVAFEEDGSGEALGQCWCGSIRSPGQKKAKAMDRNSWNVITDCLAC